MHSRWGFLLITAWAVMAMTVLLLVTPTTVKAAATVYVSPTGADSGTCGAQASPCLTIGQAVTNASAGDTVMVQAGTYAESVTLSKQLVLQGQQAIIDATGLINGVVLGPGSSGSTLSGFTVKSALGEGVLAMQVSNVTITGNTVTGNDLGAGTTVTQECQNQGSVPGDCGEGLHLMSVTNSVVSYNDVEQNMGGILVTDEMGPNHDNQILNNVSANNMEDCGITMPSHNPNALSASGQRQPSQGGVYNNLVQGNTVKNNGGAGILIAAPFPGAASYDNVITGNTISGNGMGGFTIHSHAPNQDVNGNAITNNTFDHNNVTGDPDVGLTVTAGAILGSVVVPVTGTTISGNQFMNSEVGIWLTANVATSAITNNTFTSVTTSQQVAPGGTPPAPASTGFGVDAQSGGFAAHLPLMVETVALLLAVAAGSLFLRSRVTPRRRR